MALTETAHRWLIWAGVATLIIALRLGCVLYNRNQPGRQKPVVQKQIEKDHLVVIPKFQMEDFESARQLVGKTLWVKLGYATKYFPAAEGSSATNADRPVFLPLERLTVEEVDEKPIPKQKSDKEVRLIFLKGNERYATVVGFYDSQASSYQMQLDELFYLKDPHEIYSHWGDEVWQKIKNHQLEKNMTLNQVVLSLGYGNLVMVEAGGIQLYQLRRHPGGEPGKTRVRFLDGRVKEFEVLK